MITTEQIKDIINSLEHYKDSKWNLKKVFQHLKDYYELATYNPYCTVCSSCGIDDCCPATKCTFKKNCKYAESNLNSLHFGYYNGIDLYNLIYESNNKELIEKADIIFNHNYDIVYGK